MVALPVIKVDVPDPAHLRRSLRYPNAVDLDPVAAIEAALDPASSPGTLSPALVRRSGSSAIHPRPPGC